MLPIDIEKILKKLDGNYENILQIIESTTFSIKPWKADEEFVLDDLVKYNGNLYICCVTSSNKSTFDENDFNQLTNLSNNEIIKMIENYFYKEPYQIWVRVDTEETGVTKTVVSNDTTPTDEQVTVDTVISDIPDIQVGEFVKQIAGDTSIYRRKDDSMSIEEINAIKTYLEDLIDEKSHTHDMLTVQEIYDLIGVAEGEIENLNSIIDDNFTSLTKTWSSWFINRQLDKCFNVVNKFIGMKRAKVDAKPDTPDLNTMYFIKRTLDDGSIVYDVTVYLDENDTTGIILNTTTMEFEGEDVATQTWVQNLYVTKQYIQDLYTKTEELATVAKTGKFSDLIEIPSGLVNMIVVTQAEFDAMSDGDKNKLTNGLKTLYFIKQS